MIILQATRITRTDFKPMVRGEVITEEGGAMVAVKENGVLCVRNATGLADEAFVGVSYSRHLPPHLLPKVETFIIPENGIVELERTPVLSQMLVTIDGTPIRNEDSYGDDAAAPDAVGKVNSVGNKLYFNVGDKLKSGSIQYMFEPTVSESREVGGDAPIGGLSANDLGQVGLIVLGQVGTTMFDASCDWTDVINPRLGAGGFFTTKGNGPILKNVFVLNAPAVGSEFLELDIRVG